MTTDDRAGNETGYGCKTCSGLTFCLVQKSCKRVLCLLEDVFDNHGLLVDVFDDEVLDVLDDVVEDPLELSLVAGARSSEVTHVNLIEEPADDLIITFVLINSAQTFLNPHTHTRNSSERKLLDHEKIILKTHTHSTHNTHYTYLQDIF